MLDTLRLTKRLEDAGLERRVAEAMAEAFSEGTVETVATKQDLRELETGLCAELKAETQALRTEMAALGQNLRTEMEALAQNLRTETEALAHNLRTETEALAHNLRTEMRTTAQNLRSEMQTFRWQVIAAVALMLLVHLGAVSGIVAAHTP